MKIVAKNDFIKILLIYWIKDTSHTSHFEGSLTSSEKFFYHFIVVSSKTANHITKSRALIIRFCFVVFAKETEAETIPCSQKMK